jgi:hypothetical protein
MSIEGSLALVGLVLLALGAAVSARRSTPASTAGELDTTSGSRAAPADGPPAAPSGSNELGTALLMAGVVALVAAGVLMVAVWVLFSGLA